MDEEEENHYDPRYSMINAYGEPIEFTKQQRKCVDYDSDKVLLIKGTAGSGKTYMVVKRALNYRERIIAEGSKDKVIIFTYTKALYKDLKHLLLKGGVQSDDPYITVNWIDKHLTMLCRYLGLIPSPEQGDGQGFGQYRRSSPTPKSEAMNDEDRVAIVKEAMDNLAKTNDHPYYHRDPQVWADEILWMYRNGIVDADDEDTYLELSREGRCKRYNARLTKKGRSIVMKIFNEYNRILMVRGRFEWERLYAMLYQQRDRIDRSYKYAYVLIDEAQDMTLVKMALMKELCLKDLNVAMDQNQNLYGNRWSFKRDLHLDTYLLRLDVTFRVTRQIDEFSNDLKKVDDSLLGEEDRYYNETSDKEGPLPRVVKCSTQDSQLEFIVSEVKGILSSNTGSKASIAMLFPDYKHLREMMYRLKRANVSFQYFRNEEDFESWTPGVKLITNFSAKGLGFAYVFIPYFEYGVYPKSAESVIRSINRHKDVSDSKIDEQEAIREAQADSRRLLYVAITRTMVKVYLTYSNEPSPFLSEFDPSHYELTNEANQPVEEPDLKPLQRQARPTLERAGTADVSVQHTPGSSGDGDPVNEVDDDPTSILSSMNVEFIDKRDMNGVLWIIDDGNAKQAIEVLQSRGYSFGYSTNSRSAGRRPAYYLKANHGRKREDNCQERVG